MTLLEILALATELSGVLLVFALGLRVDLAQIRRLVRRPGRLLGAVLAIDLVTPPLAVAAALMFARPEAIGAVFAAAALAPVPALLPRRSRRGDETEVIGQLFVAAACAAVTAPLMSILIRSLFSASLAPPPGAGAGVVLLVVTAPLAAGVATRVLAPGLAVRFAGVAATASVAALVASLSGILLAGARTLVAHVGTGTMLGFGLFATAALALGHLLGGPGPSDRSALSVASALRHPGIAFALVSASVPAAQAAPTLLLCLVASGVVSTIYLQFRRTARDAERPAPR